MSYQSPHLTVPLCLVILLGSASGCSRVPIAYNSAEFLIEQYASDYLALEDFQVRSWRPLVKSALADHRVEDLPYLAGFFDYAHQGAVRGFDRQRVHCLIEGIEDLYRRHMRIVVQLAAPLLAALTPDQIRALEAKFEEEQAEDRVDMDPASTARRKRKRAERLEKSISWWIGPLTERQKSILRRETAAMPDTAADWIAYRSTKRTALIGLLDRRAGEGEIQDFLNAWLIEHRRLPASLHGAYEQLRDRISELFIRMDATFSAEQRAHFANRLAGLRDDFLSLQRHPHAARVECALTG
jgi:hypothetical protein